MVDDHVELVGGSFFFGLHVSVGEINFLVSGIRDHAGWLSPDVVFVHDQVIHDGPSCENVLGCFLTTCVQAHEVAGVHGGITSSTESTHEVGSTGISGPESILKEFILVQYVLRDNLHLCCK